MFDMYVRLWKLSGANNFILRGKKKSTATGRSGSMKKSLELGNHTKGKQQIRP